MISARHLLYAAKNIIVKATIGKSLTEVYFKSRYCKVSTGHFSVTAEDAAKKVKPVLGLRGVSVFVHQVNLRSNNSGNVHQPRFLPSGCNAKKADSR